MNHLLGDNTEWRGGVIYDYFGHSKDSSHWKIRENSNLFEHGVSISFYYSTPDGPKKAEVKRLKEALEFLKNKIDEFEKSGNYEWYNGWYRYYFEEFANKYQK